MLVIFIRAALLYIFILFIMRMTGKRQIADLQPFDLLVTLTIADIASTAIPDIDTPLLYSLVPILALFLVQTALSIFGVKSRSLRRALCGSPIILIRDGVLQENMMRQAHYAVEDLCDHLRAHDVFDMEDVAFAILETNGSLSVLKNPEQEQAADEKPQLSYVLIADGKPCKHSLETLNLNGDFIKRQLARIHVDRAQDIFFMQLSGAKKLRVQLRESLGARAQTLQLRKGDAV